MLCNCLISSLLKTAPVGLCGELSIIIFVFGEILFRTVAESDLLIAVGVRFDDRVTGKLATFAPQARVIHIDIDPSGTT